jgi:hypothetical protein
VAHDGTFLYVHQAHGLFKIGSGHGRTIAGHVYAQNPEFYPRHRGWLVWYRGQLLFRTRSMLDVLCVRVDPVTLVETSKVMAAPSPRITNDHRIGDRLLPQV